MRLPASVTKLLAFCRRHRTPVIISSWPRPIYVNALAALLGSLLAAMTGCRQPIQPVSYNNLCGITSEQMGALNEEDIRQWLGEAYGQQLGRNVVGDEISITTGWTAEYGEVTAYLRDGRLFLIRFQEIKDGPALGQVVAGLGTPEAVSANVTSYGPHVVFFIDLDYPEPGISVQAWGQMTPKEVEEWAITLREDLQVDWVSCYLPHLPMEEVLREVYGVPPDTMESEVNRRIPWPGFGAVVPLTVQ